MHVTKPISYFEYKVPDVGHWNHIKQARGQAVETKIFEMRNNQSTFVRWRQQADHENNIRMKPYSSHGGLCAGITIVWLKKSIASGGKGILSAAELGSQHLMAIVHAVYIRTPPPTGNGLNTVDSIVPLLATKNLATWEDLRGTQAFDAPSVAIWVSLKPCHCIFLFEDQSSKNGHVLGMRSEGDILELFDANQGLFQYPDIKSFKQHLQRVIQELYPDCVGGNWGCFRVR